VRRFFFVCNFTLASITSTSFFWCIHRILEAHIEHFTVDQGESKLPVHDPYNGSQRTAMVNTLQTSTFDGTQRDRETGLVPHHRKYVSIYEPSKHVLTHAHKGRFVDSVSRY
jgi:hypothetical protein